MANWRYPSSPGRWRQALTSNALITGIICVALSGGISFLVAHYQADAAAQQAVAAQQAQSAERSAQHKV